MFLRKIQSFYRLGFLSSLKEHCQQIKSTLHQEHMPKAAVPSVLCVLLLLVQIGGSVLSYAAVFPVCRGTGWQVSNPTMASEVLQKAVLVSQEMATFQAILPEESRLGSLLLEQQLCSGKSCLLIIIPLILGFWGLYQTFKKPFSNALSLPPLASESWYFVTLVSKLFHRLYYLFLPFS